MSNVRVIVDPSDRSKDYITSLDEARMRLREGSLFWDIKNNCYCTARERNNHVVYRKTEQGRARLPHED